jgi:mannose-6-phosphate isomerase-like protein (cupin superfamily)
MKVSLQQALRRLPGEATDTYSGGAPFVTLMAGGSMSVKVFAPKDQDRQQPHAQDELYFIHRGTARLMIGSQGFDCASGDAFFVATGLEHRFEDFSDDFVTWVVFYGPHGGER